MKLTYYNNLDGVRAIAALMVMIFHYFKSINPDTKVLEILTKISVFGQTGVTLFFVLSGFLITRILLNTKERENYFKNFYLRRTLRIFPLYYFFLLIYFFIWPLLVNGVVPSFDKQLYFYTYLQNFAFTFNWGNVTDPNHFWSLAVEEHFYLFWPFIVFITNRKNLLYIIFTIILSAFLLRVFMLNLGYGVFYFTFTRFDSLAIGAILALIELKEYFIPKNALKFIMSLLGVFIPTLFLWFFFTGQGAFYIQIFKYLLLSFVYFLLIGYILSIRKDHDINQILESPFFSFTGKISYGLYVYHPLIYAIVHEFFDTRYIILNMLFCFILTYLIAWVSFCFFEAKFLKLKKYFDYN